MDPNLKGPVPTSHSAGSTDKADKGGKDIKRPAATHTKRGPSCVELHCGTGALDFRMEFQAFLVKLSAANRFYSLMRNLIKKMPPMHLPKPWQLPFWRPLPRSTNSKICCLGAKEAETVPFSCMDLGPITLETFQHAGGAGFFSYFSPLKCATADQCFDERLGAGALCVTTV